MIGKMLENTVIEKQRVQQGKSGFTLTEMVVAIAIILVMVAIAVPTYLSWMPNKLLKGAVRGLQSNFQHAKLEAIKRGVTVTVAFTPGAYSQKGRVGNYVIFIDANPIPNGVFDAGDTSITQVFMPDKVSLVIEPPMPTPPPVRFNSRGLSTATIPSGTVTMRNEDFFATIDMTMAGRIRIERKPVGGVVYATWD